MCFGCNGGRVIRNPQATVVAHIGHDEQVKTFPQTIVQPEVNMSRPPMLDSGEEELAILNADVHASVLDEDAWEEATDESGVDYETIRSAQWRSSTFDSVD
jgi:hypothetical protein